MPSPQPPSFVTHLECGYTGEKVAPDGVHGLAVLFNCGSGLNYPTPAADAQLDHMAPIDWDAVVHG